jgi:SAM-dependent methyltransferase
MGLGPELAELIVQEHRYRPLPPVVHTLGRLVTGFNLEEAQALILRCGVKPLAVRPEFDSSTVEGLRGGARTITDSTFFRMLGVEEIHAIDISPYEGATIIWDLCRPISDKLAGIADFIVGGSTLDNVFDPAQYIRNIARLLKPRGRLFEINHANNHMRPYVILPPPWYFDFFVVNRFLDCRVYVLEYSTAVHAFRLFAMPNPAQQVGWGLIDNFDADDRQTITVVVFAEKAAHSTWDAAPVQDAWRDGERVNQYNDHLRQIVDNARPEIKLRVSDIKPISPNRTCHNYRYIGHF